MGVFTCVQSGFLAGDQRRRDLDQAGLSGQTGSGEQNRAQDQHAGTAISAPGVDSESRRTEPTITRPEVEGSDRPVCFVEQATVQKV